jgi:hypothetical protein
MNFVRILAITLLAFGCGLNFGCNSGGPTIEGGGGLIGPKRVRVGEQFDISQPFDPKSGAEWKLTSYDSVIVYPKDFPRVETGSDGTLHRKIRFIARAPGETDMIFARRRLQVVKPGERQPEPETTRVTVRVVQ